MKTFLTVLFFVLYGASSLSPAGAHEDIRAELEKGHAFDRTGDYSTARALWSLLAQHGNPEAHLWIDSAKANGIVKLNLPTRI